MSNRRFVTRYTRAHPESELGNPNVADRDGWKLVAIRPDGQLVYREKFSSWLWGFITNRKYYNVWL